MKLVTLFGTRPEFIRLSRIIPRLDECCEQVLVNTCQNYDPRLSDVFFTELGLRRPDYTLDAQGTFGQQAGIIFPRLELVLQAVRPDRFLVLGDTNSSLGAIVAKRLGIPVYHIEAGNRCHDPRSPEEVNRRIIDHCTDVHMPYTERSRQNLLAEGIPSRNIYVTGNPINEVMQHYDAQIRASRIIYELDLTPKCYCLVTMHRQENVDAPDRLKAACRAFRRIASDFSMPVIVSTHPRTRARLKRKMMECPDVRWMEPFGFFDFMQLERQAGCVITDSGTVQEEAAILGVPSVTIRDTTERPETVEGGCNIVAGIKTGDICQALQTVMTRHKPGRVPDEYLATNVSETVCNIVTGMQT